MRTLFRLPLISLALVGAPMIGCSDDAPKDPVGTEEEGGEITEGLVRFGQNGKPTFEATGDAELKADAISGKRGISTAYDNSATQVWAITNDWDDTGTTDAKKAGMAWGEDSGLTWNSKYRLWVDKMEKIPGASGYATTYQLTTPYGKTLPAPAFECAESAMFLRALFASWYGLPFVMEASSGGKRLYIGHMGFRFADAKYPRSPNFKNNYQDYTKSWKPGDAWPQDAKLRRRTLAGGFDDLQPALGLGEVHAGTYLDELLLNKRVGPFMIYLLSYFGSMNVGDPKNTYNRKPEALLPGDIVVHRYDASGIGHVLIVKEVTEANGKYDIELMSGSMPRRQPDWRDANGSRYDIVDESSGSSELTESGKPFAAFGGGFKGWRAPVDVNGKWTMLVPKAEQSEWIDSSDFDAVGKSVETFREILTSLSPAEKRQVILDRIEAQRLHLSNYPASCSARDRREGAFEELYAFEAQEHNRTRAEVDAQYRTLADYVFAQMVYDESKTCCWNQSTSAMYDIVMEKAAKDVEGTNSGMCRMPSVFKAVNGDFDEFRNYADSIGRGAEWVDWSADESCPQANVANDTEEDHSWSEWCSVGEVILGGGPPQPEAPTHHFVLDGAGDYAEPGLLAGEKADFELELVVTRRVTIFTQDGNGGCPGDTVLTLLDGQLDQVATDDDGGEAECSRISLDLEPGDYTIEVTTYQGTNVPDYTLTVQFD